MPLIICRRGRGCTVRCYSVIDRCLKLGGLYRLLLLRSPSQRKTKLISTQGLRVHMLSSNSYLTSYSMGSEHNLSNRAGTGELAEVTGRVFFADCRADTKAGY